MLATVQPHSVLSGGRIGAWVWTDLIKSASSDEEALMGGVAVAFWPPPRVAA